MGRIFRPFLIPTIRARDAENFSRTAQDSPFIINIMRASRFRIYYSGPNGLDAGRTIIYMGGALLFTYKTLAAGGSIRIGAVRSALKLNPLVAFLPALFCSAVQFSFPAPALLRTSLLALSCLLVILCRLFRWMFLVLAASVWYLPLS